jgi:hypothetical protein
MTAANLFACSDNARVAETQAGFLEGTEVVDLGDVKLNLPVDSCQRSIQVCLMSGEIASSKPFNNSIGSCHKSLLFEIQR